MKWTAFPHRTMSYLGWWIHLPKLTECTPQDEPKCKLRGLANNGVSSMITSGSFLMRDVHEKISACVCGGQGLHRRFLELSAQFCCETKTSLNIYTLIISF